MERLRKLEIPERTVSVQIDKAKCVGPFDCGECLKNCPATVFITYPKNRVRGEICNDWDIVANDVLCWGCDVCIKVCPKNAITISELHAYMPHAYMFKIEKYANDEIVRWAWAPAQSAWTSAYLVDGLLIDSGPPASTGDLKQFIKSLAPEQAIEKVIITHWHEDHAGGARFLSEELGLPVYIHKNGIDKVRNGYSYPDYRVFAWGGPFEPAPNVRPLDISAIATKTGKYTFELLHLPGHCDDLIVLIEPTQEWGFVSDSIVPEYQMIFGEPSEDIHEDIQQIHASLKQLQQYTAGMDRLTIFTAGFGMFPGQEILAKNISDIESLHEKVHELKSMGFRERKIVEKIFGEEHLMGHITNYALSRLNLVKALLKWPTTQKNK